MTKLRNVKLKKLNKEDKETYKRLNKSIKKDSSISPTLKRNALALNKEAYKTRLSQNKRMK